MAFSNLLRLRFDGRRLTVREIGWMLQAAVQLPRIQQRLRRHGYQSVRAGFEAPVAAASRITILEAERLARLVKAVGLRHPLQAQCLPQSLWLWRKLRALGQPAELKLGVANVADRRLDAHAWVEIDGVPLAEHWPNVKTQVCEPFTVAGRTSA
jgi:hypothetical protein